MESPRLLETATTDLRGDIRHKGDHHQDRSEIEDRVRPAAGAAPWYCEAILLASVSPEAKSEMWMRQAADHLRDGDRLAEGPPEAEQHAATMPGAAYGSMTPRIASQRVEPSAALRPSDPAGREKSSGRSPR